MPTSVDPMLASPGDLPDQPEKFAFEYKWDGVRAISFLKGSGSVEIQSRNQLNITRRYPELHALADAIGNRSAILDGEIVSLDATGRPSFAKLQRRMHLNVPTEIIRLSVSEPVFYVVFDLLYLDGQSLIDRPYTQRRAQLEELTLIGTNWQVTPAHIGEGKGMLDAARQNHLEGVVAKRLDSLYLPGKRTPAWRKIKIVQRQEFVVAGWVPERGGAVDRIGSLLVGYYDRDSHLRYAGKVGTGLSAGDHQPLLKKLASHSSKTSPFFDRVPAGATFTEKPLVAEIEFRRWPIDGMVQHAAFKGLRTDKSATAVVREKTGEELST